MPLTIEEYQVQSLLSLDIRHQLGLYRHETSQPRVTIFGNKPVVSGSVFLYPLPQPQSPLPGEYFGGLSVSGALYPLTDCDINECFIFHDSHIES